MQDISQEESADFLDLTGRMAENFIRAEAKEALEHCIAAK
jgi:hypothetical protein